MTDDGREAVVVGPQYGRRAAWGVLLLLLLVLASLWTQRRPIATHFIDDALRKRGVAARYQVAQIGLRTQRLENLAIGDPRRPDLTANTVEVETAIGLRGPEVRLIRGRGIRLYGRIEGGRLKLGEIDKLLPPPSGAPFRLPNIVVDLDDTAMRLDTPAGRVGLSLQGRGNLASGFRGEVAAISSGLRFGDCRADQVAAVLRIATAQRRPSLQGPLRAASLRCAGLTATRPRTLIDATLGEQLNSWHGKAQLDVPLVEAAGNRIDGLGGTIAFSGSVAGTSGTISGGMVAARFGDMRGGSAGLNGRYALGAAGISARMEFTAHDVSAGSATLGRITAPLGGVAGTPVAPIADAVAQAMRRAGERFDASGAMAVTSAGGSALRIERLDAVSRSGARLVIVGGDSFTYYAGPGRVRLDGRLALSGGGFPDAAVALRQVRPGDPLQGEARVMPVTVGGARLALAPIRFTAADGYTHVETIVQISGPLSGGHVDNLIVPVSGRLGRGFAFGERCTIVRFDALNLSGLRLGATRLPLCPTGRALVYSTAGSIGGGGAIASPHFVGKLGESPMDLAARSLRFDLGTRGFDARQLNMQLGTHHIDIASLDGSSGRGGLDGHFSGAAGRLANVPLLVSEGRGTWRFVGGRLSLDGNIRVADAADPARFYPLASKDFRLTMTGNDIAAGGWLTDPKTGTQVAQATIRHSLASGRGTALLDVPGITFTPAYQPEQLTRLTTGVIALVDGTLRGSGEIHWGPQGVASAGTFSTDKMNLATAFGPVQGLSSTIHFTDLLGLVTAPGQVATTDLIQAGINVYDGTVRYQLLPGLKVRVESGVWPFAGGGLTLEETVLDFSQPSAKHLTFRVDGLDGARFIQQMEFDNIAATGLFDGVVPMVFDESGGRIVGGHLTARAEGGTLSYIGELTDKDLGAYGKLAFDALKSLSYDKFVIDLDGALDGEFLTRIELDGIARDVAAGPPAGTGLKAMIARRALGQIAKIPFNFNITVRGPFRALIATARSLEDPSLLIQTALPAELRGKPLSTTVQPKESEPVQ